MELIIGEAKVSLAKIYAPSITTKVLKEEEINLSKISGQSNFDQIFGEIISNQVYLTDRNLVVWATREFHRVVRTSYSLISADKATELLTFLFQILSQNDSKFEQFRIFDSVLEIVIILFSKIFMNHKNAIGDISKVLSPKNFYKFLSLFPVIISDAKIVIDDSEKQVFVHFFTYELLPQFLQSPLFHPEAVDKSDFDFIVKMLSFYNNVLLFVDEQRNDKNGAIMIQLVHLLINKPGINLAFEGVFNLTLSEESYDTVMQLIRTLSSFNSEFDYIMPLFDEFIGTCHTHLLNKTKTLQDADISIILKIISKLFQTFPEKLGNIQKAILFLLEYLSKDCDSINSLLLGFKKFLKKVVLSENRSNFVELVNVLWRKLPQLIELDAKEFKENEKIQTHPDYEFSDDNSFYDFRYVRRNTRSLAKYLVFFLDQSDILTVLQSELEKIIHDANSIRSIEALSYFFTSLFMLVDESKFQNPEKSAIKNLKKIQSVLQMPNVTQAILCIYMPLFSLLGNEWSIQVKINVLQMTNQTLCYFNKLNNFANEGFFQNLKLLIQATNPSKKRKYEKYLFRSLGKFFSIMDEKTLSSDREFTFGLIFSDVIDSGIFRELLLKISSYWGDQSVLEITQKIMAELRLNFVPHAQLDQIEKYLNKIKIISENCTETQFGALVYPTIECVEYVMDHYYSNDQISEKNGQVIISLFERVAKSPFARAFLASSQLNSYLGKVMKYLELTYIPSYIYIMETFTHRFYDFEYYSFFKFYFEKINEIILNLVQPENWDGQYFISNGVRVKQSEKFAFLFDRNGLQVEDVLDDYYGYVSKNIQKNQSLFRESPNAKRITRMVFNTFDNYYIYNIKTLLVILSSILNTNGSDMTQEEAVYWVNFWTVVVERSISLIFEESLLEKQVKKLVRLVSKIHKKFQIQTIDKIKKFISLIAPTILTDNEKQEFLGLIMDREEQPQSKNEDKLSIFTQKLIGRIREFRKNVL